MSDHHKPSSNQPVTLARPITLTSVFHLLLGIVIPSFIPLCGHRLLASGLVCIRDIYLLIDVVHQEKLPGLFRTKLVLMPTISARQGRRP
ncbi:hypothetical protein BD310DRAFT_912604 [Dichomitus squalens]|uniref:Uncharacterized protein n=1 Tax=Dichomitus squalens TaxID=114155 RepID=A0A4V2KA15_9APHY|nr:hypothetical protein BD310DRAFT_912604 [Dichomitus squalens]